VVLAVAGQMPEQAERAFPLQELQAPERVFQGRLPQEHPSREPQGVLP